MPVKLSRRTQTGMELTLLYLMLLLGAVISLFPFYWMVSSSLKLPSEIFRWPPTLVPTELTTAAYRYVWETTDVPRVVFNSTFVAVLEVGMNIVFSSLVAYAFAKLTFPGKRILFVLMLALMMLPFQIMIIPLFLQFNRLGLIDTYAGLVLPGAVSSFSIFLLTQAFSTVPNDYIDAALIDGANHFGILRRIVVPMVLPLILTTVLINFFWSWNGFLWPYLVIVRDEMATLPIALARYRTFQAMRWDAIMAAATLTSLPIVVIYLLIQRKFVDSLTFTGLKG